MIADFYKAIKRENTERVLPAKVVKELNKQLPRGYEYVSDGQGHYIVKPTGKASKQHFTGNINYEKSGIPEEIKAEQVAEYAYRTQKKIFLDEVKVIEKGKAISFPDIFKDPITGERTEIAKDFVMLPAPFPPPVPMKFDTEEGDTVYIDFRRVPYEDMGRVKFENCSFPSLKMEWIIPEKDNKLIQGVINITVTPTKAITVRDAVLALKIVQSFAHRKLKINDTSMGADLNSAAKLDNEELERRLKFWCALDKLQDIFNVEFEPGADFPKEDQHFASELFYNFIDNRDFVYVRPLKHFHVGVGELEKKEKTFESIVGKPGISLSFVGETDATLLGASFKLYQTNVLLDMTVDKVVMDDDNRGAELYILDAPGTEFKMVKRYFQTMEKAREGMSRIHDQYSQFVEKPAITEEEFDKVFND